VTTIAWEHQHTVEAKVTPAFAWTYWTDVSHWDDPPARFVLHGPFAEGTRGTTIMPDQDPIEWTLRNVRPGEAYTIEAQLDGATLAFEWRFMPAGPATTRLSQRIALSGGNAGAYIEHVRAGFGPTLADGMQRIADLFEQAARAEG
jgi:hypothetical protein